MSRASEKVPGKDLSVHPERGGSSCRSLWWGTLGESPGDLAEKMLQSRQPRGSQLRNCAPRGRV